MVNFTIDQLREIMDRGRFLSCWEQYVQGEQDSGSAQRDSTKRIIATAYLLAASGYWPTPDDEGYVVAVRVPKRVASMSTEEVQACLAASDEGSEIDRITIEWNRRLAEAALAGRKAVWTDVLFPKARTILEHIAAAGDNVNLLSDSDSDGEQQPIITGLSNIQVPAAESKEVSLTLV